MGTTDNLATSFLHFPLFSTAIWDLANSRPVHSLIHTYIHMHAKTNSQERALTDPRRGVQNVHLVARWLPKLEKAMEEYSADSHENYRLFISAEPAACAASHNIPQGILESAIKITNEPPTGMFANIHKALDNFNQVHG